MKARPFHFGSDYPAVCEWWRARNWPFIPTTHLPPTGILVEQDEIKFCVGWVYFTDSAFALMEWITTNPESPLKKRKIALEILVDTAMECARAAGKDLWTSAENKNLIKLYEERGFTLGDTNMTQLIARLT